ncbi:MAG: serine hydrolase [Leptolyngbya sp. SIO1D8]|nr:serine hydrolase [Leptolyngbya sp. SIO1D8]
MKLSTMFFFAFGIFIQANAQTIDADARSSIDEVFNHVRADGPGYAVAVIKENQIIYNKGFGLANLEYQIPITDTSVFNVASISKQFTAASIATG